TSPLPSVDEIREARDGEHDQRPVSRRIPDPSIALEQPLEVELREVEIARVDGARPEGALREPDSDLRVQPRKEAIHVEPVVDVVPEKLALGGSLRLVERYRIPELEL